EHMDGMDAQIPPPRQEQAGKFFRVLGKGREKDLRRAHTQPVEDGERVLIHLPHKEAGCGNAAEHTLSPRGAPPSARAPPLFFFLKLYHKRGAPSTSRAPPPAQTLRRPAIGAACGKLCAAERAAAGGTGCRERMRFPAAGLLLRRKTPFPRRG